MFKSWYRRAALFAAVVGPGIITSNVDNDAGGIATYSAAGASYGYLFLWTLIPITVALIVVQEMCARMGVFTGKGLSDLIRENFGLKITMWLMAALVLTNLGNTIAEFAGVAASLEIFGVPRWVSLPGAAIFVWTLVVKGNYAKVEKIFLVACLFYVAYLISCVMAKPDWAAVGAAAVTPTFQMNGAYLAMLIGVVGTTIAPWMQFYLQASIVEKGVKPADYRYCRWDIVIGSITVNVVAAAIIISCGAAIFHSANPVAIETADQAARALEPLAGAWAKMLFAFGLLNASLFAASILPLATSYTVCEAMGWETGIDKGWGEARAFYGLYTAMIVIGFAVVLFPRVPLIPIMLVSQIINGLLLPVVLVFMIILINRRDLMGPQVNSPVFNVIAWVTTAAMIALNAGLVFFTVKSFFT